MKTRQSLALLALLAAVGCQTPAERIEQRIARRPQAFQLLPQPDQARIRQGRILIGDAEDLVWVACGPPGRVYRRETAAATNTVWSYTRTALRPQAASVPVTVWDRDAAGNVRPRTAWVWTDRQETREYEVLRVELQAGRVTAIEHAADGLP